MHLRALTALLALLAVWIVPPVAPAPAASADDLAGDELARGVLLAMPSIYRVDVTLRVPELRTRDGERIRVPGGRAIAELGTATAVAPGGWLVSAAHLVDPDPATLARLGYQRLRLTHGEMVTEAAARDWVERTGARPVGGRVLGIRVTQADPGTGLSSPRRWTGVVRRTSGRADLSLLRIAAPGAPAAPLEDTVTLGTPIATIGYGRVNAWDDPARPSGRPAVRRGRIERTGLLRGPTRRATVVTTDVQRGDSGGPAVDGAGRVRGIVVLRGEGGGIMEQTGAVRALLAAEGIEPGEGRTGTLFRRALIRLWALDVRGAERDLAQVRAAFPGHTLAQTEALRAADLASAGYDLAADNRRRDLLLAIGAVAILLALLCVARLAWLRMVARPPRRT